MAHDGVGQAIDDLHGLPLTFQDGETGGGMREELAEKDSAALGRAAADALNHEGGGVF